MSALGVTDPVIPLDGCGEGLGCADVSDLPLAGYCSMPETTCAAEYSDASRACACAPEAPGGTTLTIDTSRNDYDVFVAAGSPVAPVDLTVRVLANVTVGASATTVPAFTTGALPTGSTVTLILDTGAEIIGAGGGGGSGGTGGTGGNPNPCGRPGAAGGTAIVLTVPRRKRGPRRSAEGADP